MPPKSPFPPPENDRRTLDIAEDELLRRLTAFRLNGMEKRWIEPLYRSSVRLPWLLLALVKQLLQPARLDETLRQGQKGLELLGHLILQEHSRVDAKALEHLTHPGRNVRLVRIAATSTLRACHGRTVSFLPRFHFFRHRGFGKQRHPTVNYQSGHDYDRPHCGDY